MVKPLSETSSRRLWDAFSEATRDVLDAGTELAEVWRIGTREVPSFQGIRETSDGLIVIMQLCEVAERTLNWAKLSATPASVMQAAEIVKLRASLRLLRDQLTELVKASAD